MDALEFALRVTDNLPFEPTEQQIQLIAALARFCAPTSPSNAVFVLNGYAGTGKTSVMGALIKTLGGVNIPSVLLAPTGRAAKVFSGFARHSAFTIHRKIYRAPSLTDGGSTVAAVNNNPHKYTLFVVDEASMISDGDSGGADILRDLIHYVYTGEGCKLILLGDTAQLPPVGCAESPAMSPKVLKEMGLRVTRVVMTETVRQARNSGILYNATALRRMMRLPELPVPQLLVTPFNDITPVDPVELDEIISTAYGRDGITESILITRSNKRATDFNMAIRSKILEYDEILCKGDLLLIAKNNYFWSSRTKEIDFIANGDVAEVVKVYGTEELEGIHFADVRLLFTDRNVEFDLKIVLDSLTSDTPGLPQEKVNQLGRRVYYDPERFTEYSPKSARMKALKEDPYFNALQVKYAYCVTCHKAQGGQWRNVFIDMGYIPPEAYTSKELYRWLYTSLTRATGRVYLINPSIPVK
ncbi:MAG: AAA family ATPase [Muribaculaceae bacterium]|nr:AAA family ATPase [Muribaculaceae bacterium]